MNYYDIYSPQMMRILDDDIPSVVRSASAYSVIILLYLGIM